MYCLTGPEAWNALTCSFIVLNPFFSYHFSSANVCLQIPLCYKDTIQAGLGPPEWLPFTIDKECHLPHRQTKGVAARPASPQPLQPLPNVHPEGMQDEEKQDPGPR